MHGLSSAEIAVQLVLYIMCWFLVHGINARMQSVWSWCRSPGKRIHLRPKLQTVKREYGRSWKFPLVVNMPSGNHCSCVCTAALQQTQPPDGGRQSATRPCVCVHSVLYLWLVRGVKDEGPQVCPEPGGAALPAVLLCCCAILLHNHYTRDMKTKQRMGA